MLSSTCPCYSHLLISGSLSLTFWKNLILNLLSLTSALLPSRFLADFTILRERKKEKKVKLFSHVWLFATPWTVTYQAPLSMGCGLPFSPPGDRIPVSRIAGFTVWATREAFSEKILQTPTFHFLGLLSTFHPVLAICFPSHKPQSSRY